MQPYVGQLMRVYGGAGGRVSLDWILPILQRYASRSAMPTTLKKGRRSQVPSQIRAYGQKGSLSLSPGPITPPLLC